MKKHLLVFAILVLAVLCLMIVSAQDTEWELTETREIMFRAPVSGLFHVPYPAGWFADKRGGQTVFNELEADHQIAFDGAFATQGYSISLEYLVGMDLNDLPPAKDRTLDDLLAMTKSLYGYEEPVEVGEATFLTWPALQVRTVDGMGNHIITIQSYYGPYRNTGFLFTLAAPSAEAFDAFLPTWNAMIEGIINDKGLMNIGDYGLYIACEGSGTPVVVLESGAGADHSYWSRTQRRVAEFTRVCSHDRNVVPAIESARSAQDFTYDLYKLLVAARIEPPYVLVGHSYGGFVIRLYAEQYPDEVVGMVLVDSAYENMFLLRHEHLRQFLSQEELDEDRRTVIRAFESWGIDWPVSVDQVAVTGLLGDIPLVVLTAGSHTIVSPPYTSETFPLWQQMWNELQADLATLSTNSTQIIIDTDHFSIVSLPEVAMAVQQVVDQVRVQEE